jgi:hypothetical protein
MLIGLIGSLRNIWRAVKGAGNCAKCTCTTYSDANDGNSYCTCGHSYGDHW